MKTTGGPQMIVEDKILYKRFVEGDIDAFETLVLRYKDNLIYFISRYTGGDIYAAEDIAQDVFAYIFVEKQSYNPKYSLKTFLFTLGKNKSIDHVRKQSKLQYTDFEDQNERASDEESIEDKLIRDEQTRMVFQKMKELKPEYEKAIYLANIEELAYKDIAKIMGKTLGQTKVLIHRAREALKAKVAEGIEKDEK
jgi:RNA polymerase sigma factor (sigma-70 family)